MAISVEVRYHLTSAALGSPFAFINFDGERNQLAESPALSPREVLMRFLHWKSFLCAFFLFTALGTLATQAAATEKTPELTVNLDTTEAPDLKEWGEKAAELCRLWYPRIAHTLRSEGYTPPRAIRLRFEKACDNPAETSGDRIVLSPKWVRANPDDFGMVIHELTHVIQSYPGEGAGWLVEGIADYVRFWQFEPHAPRPVINPDRASYRDAYRTTAAFLAWTQNRYDRQLVNRLNRDLRADTYTDAAFKTYTGRPLNRLWLEFTHHLRTARR